MGTELAGDWIQERIHGQSRPPLFTSVREEQVKGARLVIVRVEPSISIHADSQGRAARRVGSSCYAMSPQEIEALAAERHDVDWTAEPTPRTVDEADPAALEIARRLMSRDRTLGTTPPNVSELDLCRALGVVDATGSFLRAGELLFCNVQGLPPHIVYQYRPSPGADASLVERFEGPIVVALEGLVELIWARRHVTPLNLQDGTQIEVADFPKGAVRESVANALLHRDYRRTGSISIEHSPGAFIVTSPGPLVSGVTETNILTHPSKPRNRTLFQAARKLRIAEETGQGVDRMYRELLRSGHDAPEITNRGDSTRVAFSGGAPRTQVVRFVESLPAMERDDVDTLLAVFTLLDSKTISVADFAEVVQKSESEALHVLERLSSDAVGIVEPTRSTASHRRPIFRFRPDALRELGPAVSYHQPSVDDIDRKVIEHVQEYGYVTNRTLRNLLDVDVYRSRDLLARLQRRGVLVKISQQKRGRGIRYGAGEQFPTRASEPERDITRAEDESSDSES